MNFPDWPPERLLKESVAAYNLRHPAADALDVDQSPWPKIYWAVLSFLRHELSGYDALHF
jgi:hypothetical protein